MKIIHINLYMKFGSNILKFPLTMIYTILKACQWKFIAMCQLINHLQSKQGVQNMSILNKDQENTIFWTCVIICMHNYNIMPSFCRPSHILNLLFGYSKYVTGFWKANHIVTLGLFHFIGPANGYTCTLHIHSAIIRFGWLVCFSRVNFPTM